MINKYCVGEFNGRRLYTGLRLDYSLRLWAPTSVLHAISAVAEVLVCLSSLYVGLLPELNKLID